MAPIRDGRGNVLDLEPVEPLLERLSRCYRPVAIWLFGSRARGEAAPSSDWDLLVVVPDDIPELDIDPRAVWRATRGIGPVADVLLCRESDFEEARNTCNTLAYEATRTGRLIREH
jgi:predicted nucleotidyltransferase